MKLATRIGSCLIALGAATAPLGCGPSGPANGTVLCGTAPHACPDGYVCSATRGTCWRRGEEPFDDAGAGGGVEAQAAVDGLLSYDGPLPIDSGLDGSVASEAAQPLDLAVDMPQGPDLGMDSPPVIDTGVDMTIDTGVGMTIDSPADSPPDTPLASETGA